MKRASVIFFLILFCVYSFTFKTHYCYYAGTHERFHGDCEHEIKEAAAKGDLAHANFFPKHYICQDIIKNAQVEETKIIVVKNSLTDDFVFAAVVEIPTPEAEIIDWIIPEVHCRSGTHLLSSSLRAPPAV